MTWAPCPHGVRIRGKMELDDSSTISTPPEKEPVMECSLMLTALSGETFQVSLSVAKFDRFEDLEAGHGLSCFCY